MTPVNRVIGEGQLVDELQVTFTGFYRISRRRTKRLLSISWWSCSFAAINLPVSGSIGIMQPCCGKRVCCSSERHGLIVGSIRRVDVRVQF